MAAQAQSMDLRIVKWQQNLLDLSLRNRLLNFKPDRAVCLIKPDASIVFSRLVKDASTLTIRELANSSDGPERVKVGDREVLAAFDPKGTANALKKMRLKARSAIKEQGVNVLYIGFGLLRWYESDKSSEELLSPLVMVPMELLKATPQEPFRLRMIEEEIVANPTLALRLTTDFRISLPQWPEEGGELIPYLKEVVSAVLPMKRWSVDDSAFLGLYSFAKLSMYAELGANADRIAAHPILRALSGDQSMLPPVPAYPSGEQLDTIDLSETFQVLDADSSQQEAVEMAKAGVSFVLQGPPGTGKSQTIANIIAESLALGRKVLFVSEKMAALEVVERRLQDRGLGDYILEIHSHKASKGEVVEELRRCLQPPTATLPPHDDLPRLNKAKASLNAYVKAVHGVRQPLGRSVFHAYGRLAALTDVSELPVPIDDADTMKLDDLDEELRAVRRVEAARALIARASSNPWSGLRVEKWRAGDEAVVEAALRQLLNDLAAVKERSLPLSDRAGRDRARSLGETKRLVDMLDRAFTTPYPPEAWLHPGRPEALLTQMEEMRTFYQDLAADASWSMKAYSSEASNLDTAGMLGRFENDYHSPFRALNGSFKRDLFQLQGLVRDGRWLKYKDAVEDLQRLERWKIGLRKRGEMERKASEAFGLRFKGEATGWDELRSSLLWSAAFLRDYGDLLNEHVRAIVCRPDGGAKDLQVPINDAVEAVKRFQGSADAAKEMFLRSDMLSSPAAVPYDRIEDFIAQHLDSLPLLKERVEVAQLEAACVERGLMPVFELARKGALPAERCTEAYEKRFYRMWLDHVTSKDDVLRNFHSDEHEETIRLFRKLDNEQMAAAQKRLRARLDAFRSLSVTGTEAQGSELYALKHELNKKKNIKQIRQLFADCPHIIMELKPCLLMSPLSVSQYLDPKLVKFDLVIFDEASQVRPEDAVGSIMRGRQLIVVGDSLQLPPTSFFRMGAEDEEETIEDLESILDECASIGIRQHMLRWHYRSRDESLIAFSNRHVYNGQLYTFPSSGREGEEWGVTLVHVPNAVYDRGGAKTNPAEAKKVAELVMEHFTKSPNRSLGVIAFSEAQQMAIIDEVDKLREKRPEMEKFFAEDSSEEFFVKNLENVQGDERDVMIFSVGYGRDAKGRMTQNFGPLNGPGGERRLNVAVTRARMHVKVVSSIKAADIENATSRGASLLREYLAYAAGESEVASKGDEEAEAWSPLEEEVFNALTAEGLKVRKRVGRSGYRVDLAIEDPEVPGRYVLGIECDGASYRSGTTARDRDRLRHEVLAGLGWKTVRIWSRDWINDPKRQVEKVKVAFLR